MSSWFDRLTTGGILREKFFVDADDCCAVRVCAKPIAYGSPRPGSKPRAKRVVPAHTRKRRAHLGDISRFDKESSLSVGHDLRYPRQIRRDDGPAGAHRENQRERQPFP